VCARWTCAAHLYCILSDQSLDLRHYSGYYEATRPKESRFTLFPIPGSIGLVPPLAGQWGRGYSASFRLIILTTLM